MPLFFKEGFKAPEDSPFEKGEFKGDLIRLHALSSKIKSTVRTLSPRRGIIAPNLTPETVITYSLRAFS